MVWSLTFVIVLEVTVERGRGVTGGVVNIGWNIGSMLMTLSAFALRSWHWMQLANALFSLLLVLYYVLVPGWLLFFLVPFAQSTMSAPRVPAMVAGEWET